MNLSGAERFSRLKYPVHKVEADTVAALYKYIPGLRKHFSNTNFKSEVFETKILDHIDGETQELISSELIETEGREEIVGMRIWIGQNIVKLIKYIVFLYDEGTDLTDEYPDDIRLRKEAAAKEAGFRRDGQGEWPEFVRDIMDFKDAYAVDMILQYLKTQRSLVWRELKIIEEELDGLYRRRAEIVKTGEYYTKQGDLLALTKSRTEEKEFLLKKFYGAHDDLRKATEEELIPVSPENVFKVMKFPEEMIKITQIRDVPAEARPH